MVVGSIPVAVTVLFVGNEHNYSNLKRFCLKNLLSTLSNLLSKFKVLNLHLNLILYHLRTHSVPLLMKDSMYVTITP